MNKATARMIKARALRAVRALNAIAALPAPWERDDLQVLKRGVGLCISTIDCEVLDRVYNLFPDLDDLKDTDPSQFDSVIRRP